MSLVAAKCTECGASIEVDNTKGTGICEHCGTAFITEKVINNYNTTNVNYNTQNVTKVIHGREKTEAQEYVRNAGAFMKLGDYTQAREQLNLAVKADPSDWRVWFAMVKLSTKDFTDVSDNAHNDYCAYLKKAKTVVSPEESPELEKLCAEYEQKIRQRNEQRRIAAEEAAERQRIANAEAAERQRIANAEAAEWQRKAAKRARRKKCVRIIIYAALIIALGFGIYSCMNPFWWR